MLKKGSRWRCRFHISWNRHLQVWERGLGRRSMRFKPGDELVVDVPPWGKNPACMIHAGLPYVFDETEVTSLMEKID